MNPKCVQFTRTEDVTCMNNNYFPAFFSRWKTYFPQPGILRPYLKDLKFDCIETKFNQRPATRALREQTEKATAEYNAIRSQQNNMGALNPAIFGDNNVTTCGPNGSHCNGTPKNASPCNSADSPFCCPCFVILLSNRTDETIELGKSSQYSVSTYIEPEIQNKAPILVDTLKPYETKYVTLYSISKMNYPNPDIFNNSAFAAAHKFSDYDILYLIVKRNNQFIYRMPILPEMIDISLNKNQPNVQIKVHKDIGNGDQYRIESSLKPELYGFY